MPNSLETASTEKPEAFKDLLERPGVISALELVPPPYGTSEEETKQHIEDTIGQLGSVVPSIDAVLIPDIDHEEMGQDGTRKEFRKPSIEPADYAKLLQVAESSQLDAVPIPYRRTVKVPLEEQLAWLEETYNSGLSNLVFVGGDARDEYTGPYPPEMLKAAQELKAAQGLKLQDLVIGGICIPTRGRILREGGNFEINYDFEPSKLHEKQRQGMQFFPTQLIGESDHILDVWDRYGKICEEDDSNPNPLIIGFTPIYNKRNYNFLKWLGVYYPEEAESLIFSDQKGMTQRSIDYNVQLFQGILEQVFGKDSKATIGFYVGHISGQNSQSAVDQFGRLEEVAKQYTPS